MAVSLPMPYCHTNKRQMYGSLTDCRIVSEPRKQSMAWMETDILKTYTLSMEDKMPAEAFGHARNYG